jgi:hypothetical protein
MQDLVTSTDNINRAPGSDKLRVLRRTMQTRQRVGIIALCVDEILLSGR